MTALRSPGGPAPAINFPANPAYGQGAFRRRIRLLREPRAALALLDDTNHAMWCRIHHDGGAVTGVEGDTVRAPNTNCPGAWQALQELVGLPLSTPRRALYSEGRPRRNCTHLFDLAALAMALAQREAASRVYDIRIPDEHDGPVNAEVDRDGAPLLRFFISDGAMIDPKTGEKVPLLKGFAAWAMGRFEGDELEAMLLLPNAFLVSGARRVISDHSPDLPITAMPDLFGVCYAYAPERLGHGVQKIGTVRDFSLGVVEQDAPSLPDSPEFMQAQDRAQATRPERTESNGG